MDNKINLIIEIEESVVNQCKEACATQKCYGVPASKFETMIANGVPVESSNYSIVEEIIKKCKEDQGGCCDVSGTKACEEDSIIMSYAQEIIDFAEELLTKERNK